MYKKWEKESKVTRKNIGEYIFSHETPKASGALRRAPDPTPRYARFTCLTPLRYVGKIGRTRAGPPLTKSWIRYWTNIRLMLMFIPDEKQKEVIISRIRNGDF